MTMILLVRHGHVAGIRPERFRGRAELPLTDRGIAEAEAVAIRIASGWAATAIYTSPMGRCVATGEAIARKCALLTQVMPELNDIDYGDWQGKFHDEVKSSAPEAYSAWRSIPHLTRFPGGESLQDLAARTANALRLTLQRHPTDVVVLVGHESVNRVLLLQCLDQPLSFYWRLSQRPCALSEIELTLRGLRVVSMNDASHLPLESL